jgi:hypothetical protein
LRISCSQSSFRSSRKTLMRWTFWSN